LSRLLFSLIDRESSTAAAATFIYVVLLESGRVRRKKTARDSCRVERHVVTSAGLSTRHSSAWRPIPGPKRSSSISSPAPFASLRSMQRTW